MNPNLAQNLDPKLKETYDRIMGTEVSKTPSSPASVSGQARENLSSSPQPTHVPIEQVVVPQNPTQTPAPVSPSTAEQKVEMVNINTSSSAPAAKPSSSRKISPVVFVVLGVGFFVAYTVVWLKIFNIF